MEMGTESTDAEREAMALVAVGLSLATVGLLFPAESGAETAVKYGLQLGAVVFSVVGFLKTWRAREGAAD